jgi:hypothetical protein
MRFFEFAGGAGSVTAFDFSFPRAVSYGGQTHSYLLAKCATGVLYAKVRLSSGTAPTSPATSSATAPQRADFLRAPQRTIPPQGRSKLPPSRKGGEFSTKPSYLAAP